MLDLIRTSRASVLVWAALVAATLLSWWLGVHENGDPGDGATTGGILVLVITFVKVRFVGRHFMDVRDAPLVLRLALDVYVVGICAALCVLYVVTS